MQLRFTGDALTVLSTLPAAYNHMCVTSPPYYLLRDFGVDGQLGLESTPQEFDKAPSHCLRLALIFYLCDYLSSKPDVNYADQERWVLGVDEKAMASAIKVIETYKAHAYRVYQTALVERKRQWQDKFLQHVRLDHGNLSVREAQHLHLGNKDEVLRRFRVLQQEGYGVVLLDANHPGQPTMYFELGAKPTAEGI
jgi:hypothetical protein